MHSRGTTLDLGLGLGLGLHTSVFLFSSGLCCSCPSLNTYEPREGNRFMSQQKGCATLTPAGGLYQVHGIYETVKTRPYERFLASTMG